MSSFFSQKQFLVQHNGEKRGKPRLDLARKLGNHLSHLFRCCSYLKFTLFLMMSPAFGQVLLLIQPPTPLALSRCAVTMLTDSSPFTLRRIPQHATCHHFYVHHLSFNLFPSYIFKPNKKKERRVSLSFDRE